MNRCTRSSAPAASSTRSPSATSSTSSWCPAQTGDSVTLPALLLVDGATVTTDAAALAGVAVTAEIVGLDKGPKIRIHKFKNKTGQHTRQGHRQKYTRLRVTGIETG